jgi:hypothetical protein
VSLAVPYLDLPYVYAHDDDEQCGNQENAPSPFALHFLEASAAAAPASAATHSMVEVARGATLAVPPAPPPLPAAGFPLPWKAAAEVVGGGDVASGTPAGSSALWLGEALLDADAAAHQRRLHAHASLNGAGPAAAAVSPSSGLPGIGEPAGLAEERGRSNGALQRRGLAAAAERALLLFWQRREGLAADELAALRNPLRAAPLGGPGGSAAAAGEGRRQRARDLHGGQLPAWRRERPARERGRAARHRSEGGGGGGGGRSGAADDESSASAHSGDGGSSRRQEPLPDATARSRFQRSQQEPPAVLPLGDLQRRQRRRRNRRREEEE